MKHEGGKVMLGGSGGIHCTSGTWHALAWHVRHACIRTRVQLCTADKQEVQDACYEMMTLLLTGLPTGFVFRNLGRTACAHG